MKAANKKVYVSKAPRSVSMLQEEEKLLPMDIDQRPNMLNYPKPLPPPPGMPAGMPFNYAQNVAMNPPPLFHLNAPPNMHPGPQFMPPPPQMSSLVPGSGINASLKNKKVKIVNRSAKEEKKLPSSSFAPAVKKPAPAKPCLAAPPMPALPAFPQIDSNIAEVSMDELAKQNILATGDPLPCVNCNAIFNSYSVIHESEEGQVWVCEFCECKNNVEMEAEELPTESKLIYVLETPEQAAMEKQGRDDSRSIIFCIDMSGSMCVTQPVSGNLGLKTNKLKELKKQFGPQEGPQYCPREKKNVTYISRLECVQAAIEAQLDEMQQATPNKKIGIVTFNGEVTIIGDGYSQLSLAGDKLMDYEKVVSSVQGKHDEILGRPIGATKDQLCKRLLELEETGPTALGPALLASVSLAGQSGAGSKVILCTDGIANVGLGSLETQAEVESSEAFYTQIGELAKDLGVSISVISIASEECRLDCLSDLVEATGGDLTKVDPANLQNDFANILATQVLACNVKVTVNLHKYLGFRNQDQALLVKPTQLVKQLGSVTDSTLFTFEYTVIDQEAAQALKKIPFQVTVDHRKMNGMRCVLVDTQLFEVCENQEEILRDADFEVLARNAALRTAQLVKQGQYSEARKNVDMWQGYMVSNASSHVQQVQVEKFNMNSVPISKQLREIEEEQDEVGNVEMKKKGKGNKDAFSVGIHKYSKKSR